MTIQDALELRSLDMNLSLSITDLDLKSAMLLNLLKLKKSRRLDLFQEHCQPEVLMSLLHVKYCVRYFCSLAAASLLSSQSRAGGGIISSDSAVYALDWDLEI